MPLLCVRIEPLYYLVMLDLVGESGVFVPQFAQGDLQLRDHTVVRQAAATFRSFSEYDVSIWSLLFGSHRTDRIMKWRPQCSLSRRT
jgi:hypothetical protein